ncbi:MAG: hypothetical protein JXR56_09895 [Candidatus Cloacimonetes bacterium]|nr:hypothetical protein [Candidatus Cloacimonadota bacterium]
MKRKIVFLILLVVCSVSLIAGDLEEAITELVGKGAEAYVSPIVSAFGADLNSGWIQSGPKAKILGFTAELSFIVMATSFSGNDDFDVNSEYNFSYDQAAAIVGDTGNTDANNYLINLITSQDFTVEMFGPTITGSSQDSVRVRFLGDTFSYNGATYTVDEYDVVLPVTGFLEDLPALPLFTPQLKVGTIYGTEVGLRYLPTYEIPDLGKFSYLGFGLQHNPQVWLPVKLPVDLALAFYTQSMELGDIVTATATSYGLTAKKTFGPKMFNVTPYAGLMMEGSTMKLEYDFEREVSPTETISEKIKLELEGENSTRIILGSSFKLGFVKLNLDYNIAKYNSASVGFGFAF